VDHLILRSGLGVQRSQHQKTHYGHTADAHQAIISPCPGERTGCHAESLDATQNGNHEVQLLLELIRQEL
jgi:hypothetical protein